MYLFVVTTVLGFAGVLLPAFIQFLLKAVGGESPAEQQMKKDIARMKQQLQSISMVDQFASYARIQRKINALSQQYKEKVMERSVGEQKVRIGIGGVLWTIVGILCVWLMWEHRSDAVVSLPPDLIWPLGPLLAFPSCSSGQISVIAWLGIVRAVSGKLRSLFVPAPKAAPQPTIPSFAQTNTPVAPPLD
ncbi:hypothetical protein SK128_005579 [Halocaridina rubra]|uniref:Guided entry of tail-anchored proteins factor 1 n=1 Tax=Halocaridina rubra TaxID=373956 RepID=A0AAN8XA31_HALRR